MKISGAIFEYEDLFSLSEDIQIYASLGIKMEVEHVHTKRALQIQEGGGGDLLIPVQTIEAEKIDYLKDLCL